MAKRRRVRWDRVLMVFGPLLLILILLCKCGGSDDKKKQKNPADEAVQSSSPDVTEIEPDLTTGSSQIITTNTTQAAVPVDVQQKELLVVIDPGHGGEDAGVTLNGVYAGLRQRGNRRADDVTALLRPVRVARGQKTPDIVFSPDVQEYLCHRAQPLIPVISTWV